ncbi:hypothetical protein CHS0354_024277 [Potamilus streckersoni]|uniref:Hexosyltransferase n=1 Tax=Potamilus streckersoni TaxID=2493646 RepID=A0AAE0SAJ0_9BIVA|nr:hypothetical protein CHS0354_024277 [Potamilus streckersoni]
MAIFKVEEKRNHNLQGLKNEETKTTRYSFEHRGYTGFPVLSYSCFTNFHQHLINLTIDTIRVPGYVKFYSVSTTDMVTKKVRIETVQKNHNVSRIGSLITKSRIKTIQNLYGKSWDSIITIYPTQFLIDGRNICNVSPAHFMLIVVLSLPKNTEERQAIRETWGSVVSDHKVYFNVSARMVFMFEKMGDEITKHKALQEESDNHKDIVQIDLIESRDNLTRKMMSGLKWIKTYCNSVKYILICDDDTFINAARFLDYLLKDPNINNVTIHGWVYRTGLVRREGRYKVKIEEFPKSVFPH